MKKAPKIGQRVRYESDYLIEYEKEPRVCTGTVVAIYEHHEDVFDDDGEFVRFGPLSPESEWSAGVQVDKPLPKWWGYGDRDRFAPEVKYLTPIKEKPRK